MKRNYAYIHLEKNKVYSTRITMTELMKQLGEEFILVHRSVLVSARVIHEIGDKIYLSNGEALDYVVRKKAALKKHCCFTLADRFRMNEMMFSPEKKVLLRFIKCYFF